MSSDSTGIKCHPILSVDYGGLPDIFQLVVIHEWIHNHSTIVSVTIWALRGLEEGITIIHNRFSRDEDELLNCVRIYLSIAWNDRVVTYRTRTCSIILKYQSRLTCVKLQIFSMRSWKSESSWLLKNNKTYLRKESLVKNSWEQLIIWETCSHRTLYTSHWNLLQWFIQARSRFWLLCK